MLYASLICGALVRPIVSALSLAVFPATAPAADFGRAALVYLFSSASLFFLLAAALCISIAFNFRWFLLSLRLRRDHDQLRALGEKREKDLEYAARRYEFLFEQISDPFAICQIVRDKTGQPVDYRFIRANNACKEASFLPDSPHSFEELSGFSTIPTRSDEEKREVLRLFADSATSNRINSAEISDTITGKHLFVRIYPYDKDCFAFFASDLTQTRHREEMLRAAKENAEAANRMKSRFLSNMSHEIRTPMNAIIGLSELELKRSKAPGQLKSYAKIYNSAKNLLAILNDILDYSKIEADKLTVDACPMDLEDVLQSALFVAAPRLAGKRVEMLTKIDTDVPVKLIGDPTRLWQILKNLLDNSGKFTDMGRIVLGVRRDGRRTDNSDNCVRLHITVKDTGCGMDRHDLNKIFMPFEQGKTGTARLHGGTGLGLSITKNLVELMGGTISVESSPGRGTLFSLSIPFPEDSEPQTLLEKLGGDKLFDGKRFLIAAGERYALNTLSALMRSLGAETDSANTNSELTELLLDSSVRYDAVVVDSYLYGGADVLRTMNAVIKAANISPRALLIAEQSKAPDPDEAAACGYADVIEKPFTPSIITERLRRLLNEDEDSSEHTADSLSFHGRILLVEDNALNQEVASGMLKYLGLSVSIAGNGREALEILEREPFDAVLMDVQMPVMNGVDATLNIRKSDRPYAAIPIIAMTAFAIKEEINGFYDAGMNGVILKPVDLKSIETELSKFMTGNPNTPADIEATASQAGIENVPGLDYAQGLARFIGKKERYNKALLAYANELPFGLSGFDAVMADLEESRKLVHTLKGVSGNLSANKIFELARDFELSIKENAPDEALFNSLMTACSSLKQDIERNLA